MKTLERIATCGAIVGFLFVSSGCVIAEHGDRDRYDHDRYVREHRDHDDRDHRDERRCMDRDRDGVCDRYER